MYILVQKENFQKSRGNIVLFLENIDKRKKQNKNKIF